MLYALGALVVLFVLAVVALRLRPGAGGKSAPAPAPEPEAVPASKVAAAPEAATKGFDPDATRIFSQPLSYAPPGALKRGDALPVALERARLTCLSGSLRGRHFPLTASGVVVGRGADCDIALTDSRVSIHHAWIGPVDGRVELHDLKSTNGTFLNEHRQSVTEVELRSGDTIFFGGHKADQFRFMAD